MDVALWIWVAFATAVLAVLLVDVLLLQDGGDEVPLRRAAAWTAVWLGLAVGFAGLVWAWRGGRPAGEYLTGYVIERSLSIDNVFVLAVILGYFAVPPGSRRRALLLGVVLALVLRCVFIAGGAVVLERVAWAVYVLGALLIATGIRLAVRELDARPERNVALRLLRRLVPITRDFHGHRLIVRIDRRLVATPMLVVIVAIATTDVAFAADSVPAIFAVTADPFLVFAANAFSVLGMMALYFLLESMLERFRYLRPALAAVLLFVGAKLVAVDVVELPVAISLAVILAILCAGIGASLLPEPASFRRSTRPAPRGRGKVPSRPFASSSRLGGRPDARTVQIDRRRRRRVRGELQRSGAGSRSARPGRATPRPHGLRGAARRSRRLRRGPDHGRDPRRG